MQTQGTKLRLGSFSFIWIVLCKIFFGVPMTKYLANILTSCRIFGSILLLFFPVFSLPFYITYILCGFSDMIDGTIARMTCSTSRLGSQLDTIADGIFLIVSLIKLLPVMPIPQWLWIWAGVIAVIKIGNIVWGFVHRRQFISLHTILNKVTGLLLFLWPLVIPFFDSRFMAILVCSIAMLAAMQEGFYVITDRKPR